MNPQTPPRPGIKRPITLPSDQPRQAPKITEYDSPRSSRLFQDEEPEPFGSRSSGQGTALPPVDEPEQDANTFDSVATSSIRKHPKFVIFAGLAVLQTVAELDKRLTPLTEESCWALIAEHQDLIEKLEKAMETESYTEIRRLPYLKTRLVSSLSVENTGAILDKASTEATMQSWKATFVGTAHQALWNHIKHHKKMVGIRTYAPYCAVVQSSGLGKSRCVDELSKSHIILPMNLNNPSTHGFPASDSSLYNFFNPLSISELNTTQTEIRMHAFLTSLFLELEMAIQEAALDTTEHIAPWLRTYMTDGQSFSSQNQNRTRFYETVVKRARKLEKTFERDPPLPNAASPPKVRFSTRDGTESVHSAAKKLEDTCISPQSTHISPSLKGGNSTRPTAPSSSTSQEPLIILAFDEAHTLTQVAPTAQVAIQGLIIAQTPFSHLRRVLRSIRDCRIFSLFLSTTGKITQFTSPRELDPSNRVQTGDLSLIPPFTALGWDHMVQDNPLDPASFTFDDIGFKYQVCLGRPMFGSRYLAGRQVYQDKGAGYVEKWVLEFAASKILARDPGSPSQLNTDQKLACLAQRLPLEFMSTNHTAAERTQIENHMRVCISVDNGFTTMKSLNPSEPLLSDAASNIMNSHEFSFDATASLKEVLLGYSIHAGDRGELIGMLLLTLARDQVISQELDNCHRGFFNVVDFLKHLFTTGASQTPNIDDILKATPSVFQNEAQKTKQLRNAFANIYLHFNHFVKRGAQGHLDCHLRAGFFARNAAVMCANSQLGIDCGLPINWGTQVIRTSTAFILFQFKNDDRYSATIESHLFNMMDPVALGIITSGETLSVPIIRIVFALAGRTPALRYVQEQREGKFTAYDIWASGLTGRVFSIIGEHIENWQALLDASHGWETIYRSLDKATVEIKKTMTPMAGREDVFWQWLEPGTAG